MPGMTDEGRGLRMSVYMTKRTRMQLDELARATKLSRAAIIRLAIADAHANNNLPKLAQEEMEREMGLTRRGRRY
jgi:predicted transcriptional regulator